MNIKRKVLLIGLDCASPKTLFNDFLEDCPNIRKLIKNGIYGKLRSTDPPITIPAWMVMATSRKAGSLGVYGFRHRKNNSYNDFWITNSYTIKHPKVWDILGENNLKSIIIGVPPTYPVQKMEGNLISGFITPDINSNYTYPPELMNEIELNIGKYCLDVKFRTEAKADLLVDIYKMTKTQFKTIKYMLKNKEWNFCQFILIGLDRLHHAFWKYYDKSHQKYEPGNPYESAIKNYYKYLDEEIGEILKLIPADTYIILASDHGAKAMKGCLCVNMALEELDLLKFKTRPKLGTRIQEADIDWDSTYAWGWGGYYARVFLNVKGREKEGIINPNDYEIWRDKISELLMKIKDPDGNPMNTKVLKPEELYEIINGDNPDLMVYFDDLSWRSAGTVGYDSKYLDENDTGPDDAVHDYYGIFVIYDPNKKIGKELDTQNILDITPTILNLFEIDVPEEMEGLIIKI